MMTKNEKRLNDQITNLIKLCKEKDAEISDLKNRVSELLNKEQRLLDANKTISFLTNTLVSFNKFMSNVKEIQ